MGNCGSIDPNRHAKFGTRFGSELSHHLCVCVACIEERDEVFRCVALMHVQGE